ncbi:MAG: hypothetical protein JOS17DRAFT_202080 [Linnemannia elongata]|nr:MAG: hypothetical protein JOS17DRAFT_202080 [Linnemannia elongata]
MISVGRFVLFFLPFVLKPKGQSTPRRPTTIENGSFLPFDAPLVHGVNRPLLTHPFPFFKLCTLYASPARQPLSSEGGEVIE